LLFAKQDKAVGLEVYPGSGGASGHARIAAALTFTSVVEHSESPGAAWWGAEVWDSALQVCFVPLQQLADAAYVLTHDLGLRPAPLGAYYSVKQRRALLDTAAGVRDTTYFIIGHCTGCVKARAPSSGRTSGMHLNVEAYSSYLHFKYPAPSAAWLAQRKSLSKYRDLRRSDLRRLRTT